MSVGAVPRRRVDPVAVLFGAAAPAVRAVFLTGALGMGALFVSLYASAAVTDLAAHLHHAVVPVVGARQVIVVDLDMMLIAAFALALALAALGARELGLDRPARTRPLSATARTFAVLHLPNMWACTGFMSATTALFGSLHEGGVFLRPREPIGLGLLASVMAGICEEILVLAIPLATARRLGLTSLRLRGVPVGWAGVGILLVAARISYHLDYGLGAMPLLPWAIASIVWLHRTRSLIPLIGAHITYDALLLSAPRTTTAFWCWAATITAVGVAAGAIGHRNLTRHAAPSTRATR